MAWEMNGDIGNTTPPEDDGSSREERKAQFVEHINGMVDSWETPEDFRKAETAKVDEVLENLTPEFIKSIGIEFMDQIDALRISLAIIGPEKAFEMANVYKVALSILMVYYREHFPEAYAEETEREFAELKAKRDEGEDIF